MRVGSIHRRAFLAVTLVAASLGASAQAGDGTWNAPILGDWDTAGNWVGGTLADGAGFTANFTQPDLNGASNVVNLVSDRTIGNLVFADANPGTGSDLNWDIQGFVPLTLSGTTPTITVNAMNPGGVAIISAPLAGTQGFTKAGAGQLTLAATSAHTITGGINVDGGTLRYDDAATVPVQAITIRNGATLSVAGGIGTPTTGILNVPASMTGNIVTRNGGNINAIGGGAGATLHLTTATDGAMMTAAGNWATGGSLASVNVTGLSGGLPEYFRILSNSNTEAFTANSLQNTHVNVDEAVMFVRTNSGGNTITLGALTGTATAVLSGGGGGALGGAGTGSFATYNIGSLNTNTTFAGTIDVASAMPDAGTLLGGINLNKVGTGTLTLSGNLQYQPTLNGTANRRGGITTVTAGTLKLTGGAAIPGGVTDGVTDFVSTLRVLSGATLDVSGTTTPYSTAARQQVIGAGAIAGNYTHDEGNLLPGDTLNGTTPTAVAAAGTLTFNNALSFAGTGAVKFDISPSTVSGNDKIMVNGATSLAGTPTINFGFLGGLTTGTYTLLESAGGFTGTTASWVVNWPGRGSAPALVTNGNLLQITVGSGNLGSVTWSGFDPGFSNEWISGAAGPLNWLNNNTGAADRYFDLDAVTFSDVVGPNNTPVVNSTIALNTTVSPLAMTFNSATVAYSITGAGKISGGASLTKTGASTLILQTANDFTGPTMINGGAIDIGAFNGALGTGPLTLAGGTVIAANTASVALTNSSLTINGAGNTIQADGSAGNPLTLPAWSGAGSLALTTTVPTKLVDLPSNAGGYTGALSMSGITARFNGGGSSLESSPVTLSNGAALRDRATSAQVITLGSLAGDAASFVGGYQGGSGPTAKTWRIGTLNTSTTFDGTITDGQGTPTPNAPTHITKVGTGSLTLTGLSSYSGNTRVEAGTLSLAQAFLSDTGDVLLFTGGLLNLNTSGAVDFIDSLYVNGISQPAGEYGALLSGAQFETPLITGSGRLAVLTFDLPGDFNNDNVVDGADLVVWQGAYGANAGADADQDGDSDGADFLIWQKFLGRTNPATPASGAVPEPGSLALATASLMLVARASRRRSRLR